MEEKKRLFEEFPPVTTEEWEAVIEKDLKGADYNKKLVWRTAEGFNVRPYYRAENLADWPTSPGRVRTPTSSPTSVATRPKATNGSSVRTSP